jgi:Ca2+-binding RTX toxin-like protein
VHLADGVAIDGFGHIDRLSNIENVRGTVFGDLIFGDDLDNFLQGIGGDDVLDGALGDDILSGGSGSDTLTGGGGADRFLFLAGEIGADTITDFNLSDDVVDIAGLLDQFFQNGVNNDDYVRLVDNGTSASFEVDGDGGADSFVQIAVLEGVTVNQSVSYVFDDQDNTAAVMSA